RSDRSPAILREKRIACRLQTARNHLSHGPLAATLAPACFRLRRPGVPLRAGRGDDAQRGAAHPRGTRSHGGRADPGDRRGDDDLRRARRLTVRPRFARWLPRLLTGIALPALLIAACDRAPGGDDAQHQSKTDSPEAVAQALLVSLNEEFTRIDSVNAQIDDLFRPLPLLTPTQEQGLRQYPNASQLAR